MLNLKKTLIYFIIVIIQLEVILRMGGCALRFVQDRNNSVPEGTHIIATLGESTTSDITTFSVVSWPRQLAALIGKEASPSRIVNLALPAVTSTSQLDELMKRFDEAPPKIVITMMGINDLPYFWPRETKLTNTSWLYKLKIFRVWIWLTQKNNTPAEKRPVAIEETSELRWIVKEINLNQKIPENELSKVMENRTPSDRAVIYAFIAQSVQPPWGSHYEKFNLAYDLLARSLKESLDIDDTAEIYTLISQLRPTPDCLWLAEKYIKEAQEASSVLVMRMVKCLPKNDSISNAFFKKFARSYSVDLESTTTPTLNTYTRLSDWAKANNVCIIAMTYPFNTERLHLAQLLSPLQSEHFFLVDNDSVFREAMTTHSYEELFIDNFAGDFGHATDKGNALIAANVFEKLLTLSQNQKCHLELTKEE